MNGYPDSASKGANPSGPGLDFYRFLQGAQGTLGIVTWMNLKIEFTTKIDKIYCAPVDDLAYAQEFLYRILPRRIGQEVVLLNNVDLAAILAENFAGGLREAARHPAAVDPHHGHQRPDAPAGREDRLRREVPQRDHQERIPEDQARRHPSRLAGRRAEAPVDAPQAVAGRHALLEERVEGGVPEPLLHRETGCDTALCGHGERSRRPVRLSRWPTSACTSSP